MGVKFQDYYQTLGVDRSATSKEIQQAFRKLAREYHPDVNKAADAAEKFKTINEAYEVLRDPKKRERYDRLGANYHAGQEFTPPPGWAAGGAPPGGGSFRFRGNPSDFSDFFSAIFGEGFGGFGGFAGGREPLTRRGQDREAELTVTLEEMALGREKTVHLTVEEAQADGQIARTSKEYKVKIPRNVGNGARIRLKGKGGPGTGGGPAGDLFLILRLAEHPVFRIEGSDLVATVRITPWEAMLGAQVEVPTLAGQVRMTIPPGAQTEKRFRLRGKGLPRDDGAGDLYVELRVVVPPSLTEEEKELVEKLAQLSTYNPRERTTAGYH